MELNWSCWIIVLLLTTNLHGSLCWPTLQPPLLTVTKYDLDSDDSRKVLGSSVVTSVSVIMNHGNGTKTFLTDGIDNPELKSNVIGSSGQLMNPDKYEFYTFDETGDLVKRLMTWEEIQGLIASSDGDGILGEASMPVYYSDSIPEKFAHTQITANDFQTPDIQGVHKVVESVQNVLKSELAASQSKLPMAKPTFISSSPNWSLFLPGLLDNADDSDLNHLPGIIHSQSALPMSSSTQVTTQTLTSQQMNSIHPLSKTETPTSTTGYNYTKKPEKPSRYKTTTLKPISTTKSYYFSPYKTTSQSTSTQRSTETSSEPSTSHSTILTNDDLKASITSVLTQVTDSSQVPATFVEYSNDTVLNGSTKTSTDRNISTTQTSSATKNTDKYTTIPSVKKPTSTNSFKNGFGTTLKIEGDAITITKYDSNEEMQDNKDDNYISVSSSIPTQKIKITKPYTNASTNPMQKLPTSKPTFKPKQNSTSTPLQFTKFKTTSPANFTSSLRNNVTTEKYSSTFDVTSRPQPFVTWTSGYAQSSDISSNDRISTFTGIPSSEKLVTEQYVSSNHNTNTTLGLLFKKDVLSTNSMDEFVNILPFSTEQSVTSDTKNKTTSKLSHSKIPNITPSINNIPSASFGKEPVKLTIRTTSSAPMDTAEYKTDSSIRLDYFTPTSQSNQTTLNLVKIVSNEVTADPKPKLTIKPYISTTNRIATDTSPSETVMQRIPTINPPNKTTHVHSGVKQNATTIHRNISTTPHPFVTDSIKNLTQIAVLLNQESTVPDKKTSTKYSEYRNKITTDKPMSESSVSSEKLPEVTKPIPTVFINDCITSYLTNSLNKSTVENKTTDEPHIHYYRVPVPDNQNSNIYYYKLPAILQNNSNIHYYTPSDSEIGTSEVIYYRPQLPDDFTRDKTTEKTSYATEYQRITTIEHPTKTTINNNVIKKGSPMLQTEGRVPNKEIMSSNESPFTTAAYKDDNISDPVFEKLPLINTTSLKNSTELNNATEFAEYSTLSVTTDQEFNSTTEIFDYLSTVKESSTEFFEITSTEPEQWTKIDNYTEITTEVTSTTEAEESLTTTGSYTLADLRNENTFDDNNTDTLDEKTEKTNDKTDVSSTEEAIRTNNTSTSSVSKYTEIIKLQQPISSAENTTNVPKIQVANETSTRINTFNTSIENVSVKSETTTMESSTVINSTEDTTAEIKTTTESNSIEVTTQSGVRNPTTKPNTPSGVDLHPAPHENMGLEASILYLGDDVKRFIDMCNELSFKVWTTQIGKSLVTSRSIIISPFAVISSLAMIFLGARGSSSGIMNDFLRLDDMVTFNPHQVLQNITESIINHKNIGVANAAFVREIYTDKAKGKILDFYKERLQQYYDSHVEEINFGIIGDLLRRRTNLLVKRQTHGRIPDYLRGSALVLKPPLALFTANVFQTDCSVSSTEGRDGEMYFVVRPSTRQRRLVPIPAAVYRSGFLAGYEPGLDATAVTLSPESLVSTILVLPGQQGQVAPGDGLSRLEQRLLESSYRRGSWSRLLRSLLFRPGLELQIPRFSHKSVLNLTAGLQKMGLGEIFAADKADLRGINGLLNELHLSDMVQVNTFSTCGEDNVGARHHIETYPSSPQRVGRDRSENEFDRSFLDNSANNYYSSLPLNLRPRQARLPDNPRLRFDRPFLYIVRHNPTGIILHIGRFNPRLLP